jgi:NAD(P)-dependent dehydrogenase (short-subunit alcohol dehydrogenase family)
MSTEHGGQVVVVTGASGGIGRATALAFAARGAKVALLARGEAGLDGAVRDVEQAGGTALPIPTDVADPDQVEAAAAQAEQALGPIDVWVNVAFTSVFAPFSKIGPAEYKRVTEVSYLGYVYGTMAALKRMLPRDAGTIVQVGSALAYRGIPLQSAYCGAKHAIQGFNESLRCELLHDKSNVRVTMVQMPAVNTPQFDWVLSRLPKPAQPVPPIYQPEVAAHGVLYAADHPERREYWVGGSTAATLAANAVAPGLLDRYLARTGFSAQQDDRPESPSHPVNLWKPADGPSGHDYTAHGSFDGQAKPRSVQRRAPRPGRSRGRGGRRPARTPVNAWLAGVRAGYGAVQLLRPAYSAEQLLGGPLDPGTVAAVRVLGARQLAQAAVSAAAPSARLLALGAGADGAHALSMAVLALADHRRRRPAMVSGLVAAAFAAGGAVAARRAASRPAQRDLPGAIY